ncbi:MAG: hypothetical protein D6731_00895 [Planctomycetota bacterium]|nr:MAG: hypothetical protein D6731_00895 [Planctomycetota bacterium]
MPSPRRLAEATVELCIRRPWATCVCVLAVLALSAAAVGGATAWGAGAPPVDNGLEIWFLEDDPALVRYRQFLRDFDNDEVVIVAFRAEEGILRPANLDLVADVSRRLAGLPEVSGVTSLATVLWTGTPPDDPETIVVERLYTPPVRDAAGVAARLDSLPDLRRDLLSPDGRTTLITARLEVLDDIDERRGAILAAMERELRAAFRAAGRDERAWAWAGLAVGNEAMNAIVARDSALYSALSLLVIVLCLWISLRRVKAVIIAVVAVEAAVLLLLGTVLGSGHRLNLVSMILPSLVMVIGLTDSVYFLTTYYQDRPRLEGDEGLGRKAAIVRSLGFCLLPGLFNSVTASVGFFAFLTARMEVLREFGLFAGVGILFAFACSVVVCSAGCALVDVSPPRAGPVRSGGAADAALAALFRLVSARRRAVLAAAALAAAAIGSGLWLLRVDSDPIDYFYEDHPVRRDARFIEEAFGPAAPLEFVVRTGRPDGAKDPRVLRAMARLQREVVASEALVGNALSLTGVVERLTELIDGRARIPDDPAQVAQALELFYDPRGNDDPLHLIDWPEERQARITFRVGKMSMRQVEELIERIQARARALLPPGTEIVPAGYVPLYLRLMDYLIQGQISSLSTTFVVIFGIIALLFRSWRYALISIPPNLLPVFATLGFMGYAGIPLDGATVLIASIALGVAVDDTIHFIFKFRELYERHGDPVRATEETLRSTGVAIVTTSLVIALGFSVIALGDLRSMAYFGGLTALTMIAALVGELLVTPAVILCFVPPKAPAEAARPGDDPPSS